MRIFSRFYHTLPHPLQTFKRHVIQLLAALLFNLNITGFAQGTLYTGPLKVACIPGLNCYSCPGAIGACPIGALQNALTATNHKLPFYIIGILLAFGALFGRTICGWACPFGLIQDLLDKIPIPKIRKSSITRTLSSLKYVVLVVLVIIGPLWVLSQDGIGSPTFCKYVCPAGTLQAGIPLMLTNPDLRSLIGPLFTWKMAVLTAIIVACIVMYRPFCRFLCPLGALYSFFNGFAFLRYTVDEKTCIHCNECINTCKMDIKKVSDRECIQCGACVASCPVQAISFSRSAHQPCTLNHTSIKEES